MIKDILLYGSLGLMCGCMLMMTIALWRVK